MRRLPIRLRLTAVFAVSMAVVLVLVFVFLYLRLQSGLDNSINSGLRSRADDVAALIAQADSGLAEGGGVPRSSGAGDSFAQALTLTGKVFDSTPGARSPALSADEIAQLSGPTILENRAVAGVEGQSRLLATPITAQGMPLVIVVGSSTGDRQEALDGLIDAFLIGGPAAILLSSGLGYLLASVGLAPVESLRRRAEEITLERSDERLPLPAAQDEIHRLAETLNAMLSRLAGSLERERAFVADASHELRTPLAVLRAELEITLRGDGYDEETGAALRRAAAEVSHLTRLADDLLVIARSEDGRIAVKLEQTDLLALLEPLAARLGDRGVAGTMPIEVDVERGLGAQVDPLRIRQAVSNLLDNAVNYGADPIVVRARAEGQFLRLSVCDNGAGFSDDFVTDAFERFSRADRSRTRRGTGLGLAIVQAIAVAHGGEATIESGGEGASVALVIPLSHPCHQSDLASSSS